MTVAEYILKFLISKNVKNVFLITGGAISFVVDAFSRNKKIKYTCVAHEQAAAMMADAYSRVGKGFGATMVANNLPIKLFIINNDGYGIIKQFQELYLNKRYEASIPSKGVTNPNFKKISNAYGINYSEIKNNKEIDNVLNKILNSKKPEFVNVIIDPNQKIIPKLQFGKPIEDLSPLLPRSEFKKNMLVPSLKENSSNFSEAN